MRTLLSRVLAVAVAVGSVAVPQMAQATDEPIQMPGTNHWYQKVSTRMSWQQALEAASKLSWQGMPGHLVTVNSSAENDFMAKLGVTREAWIAGRDVLERGQRSFSWAASPDADVEFTNCIDRLGPDSCVKTGFAAWRPGEPNYSFERCVLYGAWDGMWNDGVCSVEAQFVVEYEPQPFNMPGTRHWYEFVPGAVNWEVAKQAAQTSTLGGVNGHLVTIASVQEAAFVRRVSGANNIWLGARAVGDGQARAWTWVTGRDTGQVFTTCPTAEAATCLVSEGAFAPWSPGDPNNSAIEDAAIVANRSWGGGLWPTTLGGWGSCMTTLNCAMDGYVVEYDLDAPPTAPEPLSVVASDRAAYVSWEPSSDDGGHPLRFYTVTAFPGGHSCSTTQLSCTVTGLTNREVYIFAITATNGIGTSAPSKPTAEVIPLAAGFQAWPANYVLATESTTVLKIAQAASGASIAVTGAAKATVTADSTGFGSTTFTAAKSGIQKFTASYSAKVGKKTTKYSATTQLYVPSLSGPMLKIKQGKTGKFSLQFMPPGATVAIALSDGRTLTGTADSAGKASFTPTFNTLGAVTYVASVAGVQVGTGGLTVTK